MDLKTLIIVPVYNEEATIQSVVEDLRSLYQNKIDILLVDDGSTDQSREIFQDLDAMFLHLPFNLGVGGAVQTGFKFALTRGYDLAIQFDADGQHRAQDVEVLINYLIHHPEVDMVIGSRFLEKKGYLSTLTRQIGISLINHMLKALTGLNISDPTSGFRAYRTSSLRFVAQDYPVDYPEPEIVLMLHQWGLKIDECPVTMAPRQGGVSFISPRVAIHYMFKVFWALLIRLYIKPTLPKDC